MDVACDIRDGLPIESNTLDYAVSVHALQELAYEEVVPALEELRRVLKPGGVLRLVLPDLQKGIRAHVLRKPDYFQVDGIRSAGGQFITHMLWYGHSRMLFTDDFVEELLEDAGFVEVARCRYGETASDFSEITELDNRPSESLFVEATKPTREVTEAIRSSPAPEESVPDDSTQAPAVAPEAVHGVHHFDCGDVAVEQEVAVVGRAHLALFIVGARGVVDISDAVVYEEECSLELMLPALAVVVGCGGVPGDAVATVDGNAIDKTQFNHWMTVAARTSCVTRSRRFSCRTARRSPT